MSERINYYFRDTDILQDNDIRAGMRKYGGPIVIAVLDAIYEQSFARNGYFLHWVSEDNETAAAIAEDIYLYSPDDIAKVVEITNFFVRRGIFDKRLFEEKSVLTSRRMQETFKRYKVKFKQDATIDAGLNLLEKQEEKPVETDQNGTSPETRRKPAGNPPETRRKPAGI